ncbi:eIF2 alpha kinase Hri1 [Zygosaccharomyces mellis]|uniref:Protein HRI1 n=1 Tax=Zygosaccharomyces mellis TaxID=42258 RepID=A0A4C2E2J6_9SACH|nr:eIF2 alpha kinase Hri1 [Zygosaccharomyces mellis]
MPQLLKRLAFQVGSVPNERTTTFTSISNDGHYISLRPLVNLNTTSEEEFPFEWVFAGLNSDVKLVPISEGVVEQDFNFWLDTNRYLNLPNTHRGEVQTTWTQWDSGSVAENGEVFPNGSASPGVPFFELWHPLDPNRVEQVLLNDPLTTAEASKARSIVFRVRSGQGYDGLVIVTGRWAQGFLSKENDATVDGLNFLRTVELEDGSREAIILYGSDAEKFPQEYLGYEAGGHVEVHGLEWDVIESN